MNYLWDEKNPQGYFNRSGIYKTGVEYTFIRSHISNFEKSILDIGGGSGRFAVPLLKAGFDVTVVDLDHYAIELCRQKGISKSYCIDAKKFESSNFDVILAIEVFLVTPPNDIFKVANQKLNLNGLFVFVATNKNSWRYKLHNLKIKKSKNYGEFSIREFKDLVYKNGFEIIEIKGFNWLPFKVNSNSILVPLFSKIESVFRLDKWLEQSPWLLFACKKTDSLV